MGAAELTWPTAPPKILSRWVSEPGAPIPPGQIPAAASSAGNLAQLHDLAACCRGCPLWENATQTVFGHGPGTAKIMLVGEQPGDQEDLRGTPFVGPAGQLLDRALQDAGLRREDLYLTNAVKHFKWEPRGKRRLHKSPAAAESQACRPWLDREIELIRPRAIICLGATAAKALLGPSLHLQTDRGHLFPREGGGHILATIHPSYLLRLPDPQRQQQEYTRFVHDLTLAKPSE
jgi:DNA polymerase